MQHSEIAWTHGTFNPWHGCAKVSAGCRNCYADTFSKRNGWKPDGMHGVSLWGKDAPRRVLSESYFREPLRWQASIKAGKFLRCGCGMIEHRKQRRSASGTVWNRCKTADCNLPPAACLSRMLVFSGSMCDIFEPRLDTLEPFTALLGRIRETADCLTWQLLTKRPESILDRLRQVSRARTTPRETVTWVDVWLSGSPPANVWLGTSVEDNDARHRAAILSTVPAVIRFLSCEPLIAPLDLFGWTEGIDWIIAGGESGHGRRPFDPAWIQSIADVADLAGIPLFVKQAAALLPGTQGGIPDALWKRKEFPKIWRAD